MFRIKDSRITQRRLRVFLTVAFSLISFVVWAESSVRQAPTMPDGTGKEETRKLCSQCHEIEKSLSPRQDRAGWQRTVKKMTDLGMKGTEKEIGDALEYRFEW